MTISSQNGKKGGAISVQVVADNPSRQRGLMYRRELPQNQGMLFVFPDNVVRKMWMKNTYVALDMLFLDEEFRIVGYLENIPILNEEVRTINKPSKYVVELAAGTVARNGISIGDRVELAGTLPDAS